MPEICHIIGGGPSAQGLDFTQLKGFVIGVNDSYFNAPCDMVLSIDGRWMRYRWEQLRDRNANAWMRKDSFEKHVGVFRTWPNLVLGECKVWESGLGPGMACLHGNNSGLVALHAAYHLRFDTIFLYGFDMGFDEKKHWYPEYEWSAKGNQMYPAFINQFDETAKVLKDNNIQVFNVSTTSKLECFEKVSYDTAKNYQ